MSSLSYVRWKESRERSLTGNREGVRDILMFHLASTGVASPRVAGNFPVLRMVGAILRHGGTVALMTMPYLKARRSLCLVVRCMRRQ